MKKSPTLIIFDVGHGSCTFLQDGTLTTVIDCKESTLLIDFLLNRKIRKIDQVIISHSDADHIDGILALIQSDYVQLGAVFVNADASKNSEAWQDLRIALQDASDRGKLKVCTEIGDGMMGGLRQNEVTIEVVAPGIASRLSGAGGRTPQRARASSNTMSVVLRLHHENHPVMLIPGDLDAAALVDIVARKKALECDILLFPHHGGHIGHGNRPSVRAKNNETFARSLLDQTQPKFVLFSIGRGRFSTPRPEFIKEIQAYSRHCHIHCTQLSEHCHRNKPNGDGLHLSALPSLGSRNRACCGGSIEIQFAGKKTVDRLDRTRHTKFVNSSVATPLCRPVVGQPKNR